MAALCIGGVCVPYTAILPLCALGLKWLAMQLARVGLLPTAFAQRLGVSSMEKTVQQEPKKVESTPAPALTPCCGETKEEPIILKEVPHVETVEEWRGLIASDERIVVAKFTASWCGPCKKIEPFYQELAQKYDAEFVKVDVDDLDEIAQECEVAMMPTFVVLKGSGCTLGSMSGTNKSVLEKFVSEHCPARVRT